MGGYAILGESKIPVFLEWLFPLRKILLQTQNLQIIQTEERGSTLASKVNISDKLEIKSASL